jgi:hypothetical protein
MGDSFRRGPRTAACGGVFAGGKEMDKKKGESKLRKKLDSFWMALFLTPEGRPKSAMLLYAFCMSVLFIVIYGACYYFLIDVLERMFANYSVGVRNLTQAIVPGVVGSAICGSTYFLQRKEKRIIPVAYLCLWVYAVAIVIMAALLGEAVDFQVFMYFFAMLVPTGLITGSAYVFTLYRKHRRAEQALAEPQGGHAAR